MILPLVYYYVKRLMEKCSYHLTHSDYTCSCLTIIVIIIIITVEFSFLIHHQSFATLCMCVIQLFDIND